MADDERIIARPLRLERIADYLRRAAEFGQRMKISVGRVETMDFEPVAGTGGAVQKRLQPPDIGCLFLRVNKALIPNPGGTRRFGHMRSPGGRMMQTLCCRIKSRRRAIPGVDAAGCAKADGSAT